MKIQTILDQIDLGAIALPEFQRGYVWNRDQVRRLMNSLYRKHPVGSLLVWITKTEVADTRGAAATAPGSINSKTTGNPLICLTGSCSGVINQPPGSGPREKLKTATLIFDRGCLKMIDTFRSRKSKS